MILLHRPDGGEILVSSQHVAALIPTAETRGGQNRLVPSQAQCVVRLMDREIFAVREKCVEVRALIEGAR